MTELRKFSESLPMLLHRARDNAMARFRPIIAQHGLTEPQWRVLRALYDNGSMGARQLVKECAILAPSITRIIRRLSNEGFIRIRKSSADQRGISVTLLAKGRRKVDRIGPQIEEEYQRIRDTMQPHRLTLLYELLHEMIESND